MLFLRDISFFLLVCFSLTFPPTSPRPSLSVLTWDRLRNREKMKETTSSQQWAWALSSGGVGGEHDVFGGCGSFLASAQCSNTSANSVTGGINSSALRSLSQTQTQDVGRYRHRCITLWMQQTKKRQQRGERGRERVCRMCWENRAQWYIADEYFKGSSVMWGARKMKTQEDLEGNQDMRTHSETYS